MPHLTGALEYSGFEDPIYEILNSKRRYYLESKYQINIVIYDRNSAGETRFVKKPLKMKHEKTLNILLKNPLPQTSIGEIDDFYLIQSVKLLPKLYVCTKTKKCKYDTYDKFSFTRHLQTCGISNVKVVECQQWAYGNDESVVAEMVKMEIVPPEALNYRNNLLCTWDIETMERKTGNFAPEMGMVTEATHSLLSLAVGSNLPNYKPKCWIRRSSCPSEETRIIKNFVNELKCIRAEKLKLLPEWIEKAEEKIFDQFELLKRQKTRFTSKQLGAYRKFLKKLKYLDVFGFNTAKFDLPVIIAPLILELQKDGGVRVLKKMSAYLTVTTAEFAFKDAYRFTSPCGLDQFLKVCEAPASKSIWPYALYNTVDEIKAAKNFPSLTAFASELHGGVKPGMKLYISQKREFYRRKLLPKGDPDRICSMYGFLRYYNLQDVQPLATAIENCFTCYDAYFKVNAILEVSLPTLTEMAMFKNFDKEAPLIQSFAKPCKEVNLLFRDNVIGGLVNAWLRHVITENAFDSLEEEKKSEIPPAARFADNGDPFKTIIALDFTSMYLSCQKMDMPTTPGIDWTLVKDSKSKFKKNIMSTGHSFKAQQWLSYMQMTDPFLDNEDGTRTVIESQYHRGEKKLYNSEENKDNWSVDGFALKGNQGKVYEFNGEKWHKGCPHCDSGNRNEKWERKKADIDCYGYHLEVMWECQFDKLLPQIKETETEMPDILFKNQTESELLDGIKSGKFYGFLECTVSSPPDVLENMADYPPVIKRIWVKDEHLTDYMKGQIAYEKPHLKKFERETVVQCFNAEKHLLLSDWAQFYMANGLKISNVTRFVQYLPKKALLPFAQHVTEMRIAAEKVKHETKSKTAKIFGNAAYGKVI